MIFSKAELIALTELNPNVLQTESIDSAHEFCKKIATTHYENFPVGSVLISKADRKHFYSVYAFSRITDDIADEDLGMDSKEKINLLTQILKNLKSFINGSESKNPIFIALNDTIKEKNLPISLFERLINAFIADSNFKQPEKWQDLYDYCDNSANPIGELVLRITGNYSQENLILSNAICTALQLANFWQDLSVDLDRKRIYIPIFLLEKYKISKENLLNKKINANLIKCLDEVYNLTRELFYRGENLHKFLNSYRIKKEIRITWLGGMRILDKTERLGDYIIMKRPKLGKLDYLEILIKSLF
jgi:squalene synthase HpnC